MDISSPAGLDVRGSGVESIVALVIEGNSLESVFSLFDVGARSNFIILEEDRAACLSLRVYTITIHTSALQEGL